VSGFAGVINADGTPVDEGIVRSLAEHLKFRGPDGTTVRPIGSAAFCFTLARTGPAPQSEHLPITLDGGHWLIGDVRLDGRDAVLDLLNQRQEREPISEAQTDEELVLRVWRDHGPNLGEVLLGEYAFGVWEPERSQFSAIRDVIGAKPFFYAQTGNAFCFSNTLDALRTVPGVDLRLDEHFVGDFLLQGWCPDLERTVYRGIRRLKPGHALEYRDGRVTSRRFVALPIQDALCYRHGNEYVEHFRALLSNAVRERLPSGKAAFFMSGGLDSTSVAAMAQQGRGTAGANASLRAFTIDFQPLFDDPEPRFATQAARHLGMPIEIVKAGDEQPFACWTDHSLRFPEPLHEPFQSRHVALAREVCAFARVVLSGDGGDDILTGIAAPYARHLLKRGKVLELAKRFGSYLWRKRRLPAMGTGLRGRFRTWRTSDPRVAALPEWLQPDFAKRIGLGERLAELQRGLRLTEHPIHPVGYAALSEGYWSGVLEDEDAAWLGVPLDRRAPFLDRRLLEFLLRVPPLPWCMEKELLREAMRGLLPEHVRTRRKTPIMQSPFAVQVERLNWKPLPPPQVHPVVAEFVDWGKLDATLSALPGSQLWDDLRPLTLNAWVKGVENDKTFLYPHNREN
jgi:asparagine synthase (glutamine-hydrolysing)